MRRLALAIALASVSPLLVGSLAHADDAVDNYTPTTAHVLSLATPQTGTSYSDGDNTPDSQCTTDTSEAWFTFTPAKNGVFSVSAGAASAIDMFSGSPGSLTHLFCNDERGLSGAGNRGETSVIAHLDAGTTYYFRLAYPWFTYDALHFYRLTTDPTVATAAYTDTGPGGSLTVDGPYALPIVDTAYRRYIYVGTRPGDVSPLLQSQLTLTSGSRTCIALSERSNSVLWDGTAARPVIRYALLTNDVGCDPDRQMNGGTYDIQLGSEVGATIDVTPTPLSTVDVFGPGGVQQPLDPGVYPRAVVIDYDATRETVLLESPVFERWTDGSWLPAASRTLWSDDIALQTSVDGGLTWSARPTKLPEGTYLKGSHVQVQIQPHTSALWRFTTPTQPFDFSGRFVTVISSLDRYEFEPLQVNTGIDERDDRFNVKTSVRQQFEDDVWRVPRRSQYAIEFRLAGSSQWRTYDTARVGDRGVINKTVTITRESYWRVRIGTHTTNVVHKDPR